MPTPISVSTYLRNGPFPASFFIFVFSYSTITEKLSSQRDSNSDRQSSRQERWPLYHHHDGPSVSTFLPCHQIERYGIRTHDFRSRGMSSSHNTVQCHEGTSVEPRMNHLQCWPNNTLTVGTVVVAQLAEQQLAMPVICDRIPTPARIFTNA